MTRATAEAGKRLVVFTVSATVLLVSHASLLDLPFFWDELGQFVPAALDLYKDGSWIPHSTVPNVHPPGLMACLALIWHIFGYSIQATRVAMLLAAAAALLVVFLLAKEMQKDSSHRPVPLVACVLLCLSPLFFAQSMLAQLDMPAMLFTCLALWLFLKNRMGAAVAACTALVLVKETGAIVPAVLAGWLAWERRRRDAGFFLIPILLLAGWIAFLRASTGHALGNPEFTEYNLFYPLHPIRVAIAFCLRLYSLFVENFQWIGAIAIVMAWRRGKMFRTRAWKLAAWLVIAHVLAFSLLGGAVLDRYLLPVVPVVLIAMAVGILALRPPARVVALAAIVAGLLAGHLWNPPYPFPFEENLAFVDFVRLHQNAARFLETSYSGEHISTAWPLTSALMRPEFGYVTRALVTLELGDFSSSRMQAADWSRTRVLALYSRQWNPRWSVLRIQIVERLLRRFYRYETSIGPAEIERRGFRRVARFERRGQWLEIYQAQ